MTQYSDLPQITALYQQREFVTQITTMLDRGGLISAFTVSPKIPEPGELPPAEFPIQVSVPPESVTPTLINDIRQWCAQRQTDIDMQLADLGVTRGDNR